MLGMSPIAIGFFCAGAKSFGTALIGLFYGLGVCAVALFVFHIWIEKVKRDQSEVSLNPVSVVQRRSGPTAYFMAYVLPIVLGSDSISSPTIFLVVVLLLLFCFFSESEENNPIAKLMGYRFYDVTTQDGITFLVMSKAVIQDIRKSWLDNTPQTPKLKVIKFDDSFFIHVEE